MSVPINLQMLSTTPLLMMTAQAGPLDRWMRALGQIDVLKDSQGQPFLLDRLGKMTALAKEMGLEKLNDLLKKHPLERPVLIETMQRHLMMPPQSPRQRMRHAAQQRKLREDVLSLEKMIGTTQPVRLAIFGDVIDTWPFVQNILLRRFPIGWGMALCLEEPAACVKVKPHQLIYPISASEKEDSHEDVVRAISLPYERDLALENLIKPHIMTQLAVYRLDGSPYTGVSTESRLGLGLEDLLRIGLLTIAGIRFEDLRDDPHAYYQYQNAPIDILMMGGHLLPNDESHFVKMVHVLQPRLVVIRALSGILHDQLGESLLIYLGSSREMTIDLHLNPLKEDMEIYVRHEANELSLFSNRLPLEKRNRIKAVINEQTTRVKESLLRELAQGTQDQNPFTNRRRARNKADVIIDMIKPHLLDYLYELERNPYRQDQEGLLRQIHEDLVLEGVNLNEMPDFVRAFELFLQAWGMQPTPYSLPA